MGRQASRCVCVWLRSVGCVWEGVCAAQLVRFRLKLIPMRGSDEGACSVISAARVYGGRGGARRAGGVHKRQE